MIIPVHAPNRSHGPHMDATRGFVRSRFLLLSIALTASVGGCNGCGKTPSGLLADAAPPPHFSRPPAQPDPRFTTDVFWTTATDDDPMDLAALADHEGATGLLEGLEQGGPVGLAALHALPYASDAELALRRLGEIALQTKDDRQLDVLVTVRRIAEGARQGGEPLDPGGPEACIQALEFIAKSGAPKGNRYEAEAALRAFSYRGAVDPAQVPAVD